MVIRAIICTFIGAFVGCFVHPDAFAVSIPIAIMGGFILKTIKDNGPKNG